MGDLISDALSMIMNAERVNKKEVVIKRNSKLILRIMDILKKEGYIKDYKYEENNRGGILKVELINKINKIGSIRPRFPCSVDKFEKYEKRYLPAANFGIIILSTNQGLMTHKEAKEKNIGGILLAYCY